MLVARFNYYHLYIAYKSNFWRGLFVVFHLDSRSLYFSWKKSTETMMGHIHQILVKALNFFNLPWLRTPSSSNTCHMPTAWLREWTQVLCCIIQSTSSVPTQHCLKDKWTERNEKGANQERSQTVPTNNSDISNSVLFRSHCRKDNYTVFASMSEIPVKALKFWENLLQRTANI